MASRNERKVEVRVASEVDRQFHRNFQQAQRSVLSLQQQLDQASRTGVGRFNSSLDIAKSRLSSFVGVATAAAAGGAIIRWATQARESANNLGESINAVERIFESAAGKVLDFGENAATSVGLAQSEFNQLVVPIGSLLRNFGFSADQAADGAIELTRRAADLASVFNTDVSEALEAIQAALRGQSDPIERFGGSISAARVEAYLLEQGIVDSTSAITDQDKVLGRYQLLLEDTARAAGDFAATAEDDANAARIFDAELENLQARVGQNVVPAFDELRTTAGEFLPIAEDLAEQVLPSAVDAFGDFLAGVVEIVRWVGDLPPGLKAAAAGFVALNGAARLLVANPVIAGLALVAAGIIEIGDQARQERIQVEELADAIRILQLTGDEDTLFATVKQDVTQITTDTDDLIRILRTLGLTLDDLTNYALGDPAAIDKVTDAFERQKNAIQDAYSEGLIRPGQLQEATNELVYFQAGLDDIAGLVRGTNEDVERQIRLERELNDDGQLNDKLVALRNQQDAAETSNQLTEEQILLLEEQKEKTEELDGAVTTLARKYAGELRTAALSFFDIFEQAPDTSLTQILNEDGDVVSSGIDALLTNAETRLDQITRFLEGIGTLQGAGLNALAEQFRSQGPQALGDLEAVLADLDAGGSAAFQLDETIAQGKTVIDSLTSQLGAELAAKQEPLLAEFQAFGVDLGEAISTGLDSVSFNIDVDAAVSSRIQPSAARLAGARAAGGRVNPHEAYLVGDGGRTEVLTMGDQGGYVYPSVDSYMSTVVRGMSHGGGATSIVVHLGGVHVDARGASDPEAVAYAARRGTSRELRIFEAGMNRGT